jgi:PAS domain S-box-containing protein
MREQDPRQSPWSSGPESGEAYRLADFLRRHREDILSDWEEALRARHPERPLGDSVLREHLPEFLDWLADAAEQAPGDPPWVPQALTDGHALPGLEPGYAPGEVAREYGLLRHCILRRMEQEGDWPGFSGLELLDESIDLGLIGAITRDAHVRERLAQAEAQRSMAQLDTLLEASPVGIGLMDRELRYLRINDTLAAINGQPVAFHLGKRMREVLPGWVSDIYEPLFRHILETGQPVSNHEFISRDPHGTPHHWLGNYYPVRAGNGEVLGLGCVVVDITEQKEVEAELRRSGELREQLIGVLGHDLRNPLNAISASAYLLRRTEELSDGAVRAVDRIRNSAARMTRMLSDILDFARSSMGGGLPVHREWMNLHDTSRSTLEELQVAHPDRKLELEVRGEGWGWWDPDRLAQVVGNLLSNALQHGRPDTPVRVEVRDAGSEVRLSVHNEGEPIPAELRATLFQPFRHGTTGKPATRSVGLGLYIVQQVVHAHGGEVEVHSSEGEGTTFTVRLPRGAPGPEEGNDIP